MGASPVEVTFTLDVEDYEPSGSAMRAPRITREILAFLADRGVVGTFFVVGELAAAEPALLREIAAAGHEVALHGFRHVPLTELAPAELRADAARGKALLEDLTGTAVSGFRAPSFSLVAASAWAAEVLADSGFTYSSSVLPARSPLFGYPGRPATPFRWPCGLLELPCPVTRVGSLANPYLGGVYFRVLPWVAVRRGLRRASPAELLWTYCHPYDFDPEEPFRPRPGLSAAKSRLLWLHRSRMYERIDHLVGPQATFTRAGAPLAARAATLEVTEVSD